MYVKLRTKLHTSKKNIKYNKRNSRPNSCLLYTSTHSYGRAFVINTLDKNYNVANYFHYFEYNTLLRIKYIFSSNKKQKVFKL